MASVVFDIGMNNGDDTAYYLHKGYDVVAVEAEPTLCRKAEDRFSDAIRAGRLNILNVGIAREVGEAQFWISSLLSEWNSFDKNRASKGGGTAHSITIPCQPLREIVKEYGVPHYLKVDIEGNDRLCLEDLTSNDLPRFVSIEMQHEDGNVDIGILGDLGYKKFQCIRQNDFRSIDLRNVGSQIQIRKLLTKLSRVGRAVNGRRFRPVRDGGWEFARGSSGPFGDLLPDSWISLDEIQAVWRRLMESDKELAAGGLGEWFDIHAKL